ncbi:hypothetical protein AVEN_230274-1 [Araneus ventricosus]|uniref:Uncharacterized protein n=1 Tax=Araneus ventricosus TaxID=182803 RepID=A0A4Y2R044_ARAVE|nr:hypothetical protein AVEN_230274-1 [Araneus ventricosus]
MYQLPISCIIPSHVNYRPCVIPISGMWNTMDNGKVIPCIQYWQKVTDPMYGYRQNGHDPMHYRILMWTVTDPQCVILGAYHVDIRCGTIPAYWQGHRGHNDIGI